MILEIKFDTYNWWGYPIYRTRGNTPIALLVGEGFYTLADPMDVDSEPDRKLKTANIKIVGEFTN